MQISLPEYIKSALNTLEINGFECYCVGGAIRDLLLGKNPFDFDITTNAKPEDIIRIFEHTVPTGIKHGTVTVIIDRHNIEITTYRSDRSYSDHRKPDNVSFLSSVEQDVMRRDFTMNSILYNPKSGIYDPQNGLGDLNMQLIRAVGDPEKRFREDALRIMRAFRFSAQLGFELEDSTRRAALKLLDTVRFLSKERIFSELKKIICSPYPQNADLLFFGDTFDFLGLKIQRSLNVLSALPYDFTLRFAYLCKLNSINCKDILKALKSDNDTLTETEKILTILNSSPPKTAYDLKLLLNKNGPRTVDRIINSDFPFFENSYDLKVQLNNIFENDEPYSINRLKINGNDLIALGFSGENIGTVLNELLDSVMKDPKLNTHEKLISLAIDKQ